MKRVASHFSALVIGVALAALFFRVSAAQASFTAQPIATPPGQVLGIVPASWRKVVQATPSSSFVVPSDAYYVVSLFDGPVNDFRVDGGAATHLAPLYSTLEKFQNDAGVAFPPGTVLSEVNTGSTTLFGYLHPTRP